MRPSLALIIALAIASAIGPIPKTSMTAHIPPTGRSLASLGGPVPAVSPVPSPSAVSALPAPAPSAAQVLVK